jgi:hypothetical protein
MKSLMLYAAAFAAMVLSACGETNFISREHRSGSGDPGTQGAPEEPSPDEPGSLDAKPNGNPGEADTGTDTGEGGLNTGGDLGNGMTGEEEEYVKNLPGEPAVRVGVNFEDLRVNGDSDYNDAVLCFKGKFKVDGSKVVSTANQKVEANTWSISGCHHEIRVVIEHRDGTSEPEARFDSRTQGTIPLTFKVGSRLEVFMTPTDFCDAGVERDMHAAQDARVQVNVCNDQGN